MQLERRRSEPSGRDRLEDVPGGADRAQSRELDRKTHPAWYQPFLYLSLVKGAAQPTTDRPSVIG